MRKLLLLSLLIPAIAFGQKKDSITTDCGFVIKEGDQVQLGLGTSDDGRFRYARTSEWLHNVGAASMSLSSPALATANDKNNYLASKYSNSKVTIKNIKSHKGKRYLAIKGGYEIDTDAAIKVGELVLPKEFQDKASNSENTTIYQKADELAKLKKLLDDGVLTKEEFEVEKKKVLDKK